MSSVNLFVCNSGQGLVHFPGILLPSPAPVDGLPCRSIPLLPRAGADAAAATVSSPADDLLAAAVPLRWNPAATVSSAAGDLPATETKDRPRVESVNDDREHRADQISGRGLKRMMGSY